MRVGAPLAPGPKVQRYYKIVKKRPENASRRVPKSKIFLSPVASALQASARKLGPSGRDSWSAASALWAAERTAPPLQNALATPLSLGGHCGFT